MADYYVLEGSTLNNSVTVAIHIVVPTGSNDANKPWKDVVAELRAAAGSAGTTAVTWLSSADTTKLDDGTLYELSFSFEDDAHASGPERAANLDAAVSVRIAGFVDEFANRFRFYGMERTI